VCLEAHEIISSEHILSEVKSHLAIKFRLPSRQAAEVVRFLRTSCTIVEPEAVPKGACRDPEDLPVIGTALAGGALYLVTGDKDLLSISEFRGTAILNPREFYEVLSRPSL
jgi:uncharacterized protein